MLCFQPEQFSFDFVHTVLSMCKVAGSLRQFFGALLLGAVGDEPVV